MKFRRRAVVAVARIDPYTSARHTRAEVSKAPHLPLPTLPNPPQHSLGGPCRAPSPSHARVRATRAERGRDRRELPTRICGWYEWVEAALAGSSAGVGMG